MRINDKQLNPILNRETRKAGGRVLRALRKK